MKKLTILVFLVSTLGCASVNQKLKTVSPLVVGVARSLAMNQCRNIDLDADKLAATKATLAKLSALGPELFAGSKAKEIAGNQATDWVWYAYHAASSLLDEKVKSDDVDVFAAIVKSAVDGCLTGLEAKQNQLKANS